MTFRSLESLLLGHFLLGLCAAVAADVDHAEPPLPQHAADQSPPMTVRRVFLTAQKRRAAGFDGIQEPLDTLLKLGRSGQPIVADVPFAIVEFFAFRPASQEIAKKQVLDSSPS